MIRPLSVNEGYQGRRFKTTAHKNWETAVHMMLPKTYSIPDGQLEIYLKFGFSSARSDWDNCIKFFQDCLSKKYKFNDKMIRRAVIDTEIVKPGNEFIQWEIKKLENA